jgi:hypothetical protein
VLFNFNEKPGARPDAAPTIGSTGLYGTTAYGDSDAVAGTVFFLKP